MPATLSYPGVYIEEVPSGVHTITGVATSITAFIGRARRGPVNEPITINSFADFERAFGGLWEESTLGYAVRDFYLNGGNQAVIVRLYHPFFANEEERTEALNAANAVADAASTEAERVLTPPPGPTVNSVRDAANTRASEITGESASAARIVADAAVVAARRAGALPRDVASAAREAIAIAAPVNSTELNVGGLRFEAANPGKWGANLRVEINKTGIRAEVAERLGIGSNDLFNLTVRDSSPGGTIERILNISLVQSARRIDKILAAESSLIRWRGIYPPIPPATPTLDSNNIARDEITTAENNLEREMGNPPSNPTAINNDRTNLAAAIRRQNGSVSDGLDLEFNDFFPGDGESQKQGLYSLEKVDLFNLLCIPPYKSTDGVANQDVDQVLIGNAAQYCEKRRAMLIIDPPKSWTSKTLAVAGFNATPDQIGTRSKNAAIFFPRVRQPNPLRGNQVETFAPCGTIAGVIARTDSERGVWKAPAGINAALVGVPELNILLTDAENGELNQLGINCLRTFSGAGRVVWGARTLQGDDQLASEWKYIPVRRTALFIEESLYRGLKWVVFEPNDEPLWAQIRLNVGSFMQNLFRQGAFAGRTPREAYLVKCDRDTTTQNDVNLGIVNIIVGFAPLKPAEFVIVKIQQLAGQIQV